jgi:hypothetical protein
LTDKLIVRLKLEHLSKLYDGTSISYTDTSAYESTLDGFASDKLGVSVQFNMATLPSITRVGRLLDAEVKANLKIYRDGTDITSNCEIVLSQERLEVRANYLKLVAGSATMQYEDLPEGGKFTLDVVTVQGGILLENHTLRTRTFGQLSNPGSTINIVSNYQIIDKSGVDVTQNYDVECVSGTLKLVL